MQKDIDSKMKSMEDRMEDMQRDVKDLKCQLHTAECLTEKDLQGSNRPCGVSFERADAALPIF